MDRPILVIVLSEFDRTPKLNKDLGRDHWTDSMPIMLAGYWVKDGKVVPVEGGRRIGKVNEKGVIKENPIDVKLLVEFILNAMGFARFEVIGGLETKKRAETFTV